MADKQYCLYLGEDTILEADFWAKKVGAKNRSVFVERAVEFYLGYLKTGSSLAYMHETVAGMIQASQDDTVRRINAIMFKMAVELGVICNIVAAQWQVDEESLKNVRDEVYSRIKRTGGVFGLHAAVDWQQNE